MYGKMSPAGKAKYISVSILFIVLGGVIGAATYVSFIPQTLRTPLKAGVAVVSLATWFIFSQNESLQQYKQIAVSFFSISLLIRA